jgi:uncharacterized protein (DUF2249 family)
VADLLFASSEADAQAVRAVVERHAQVSGALVVHVDAVISAARAVDAKAATAAREALLRWCTELMLPVLEAEEQVLHSAAAGTSEGRLLVEALLSQAAALVRLAREVGEASDLLAAAIASRALREVLEGYLAQQDSLLLPLLAAAPTVSVADLTTELDEVISAAVPPAESAGGCGSEGHSCGCGEVDGAGHPELDARAIPHAIRHATIFGALDAVAVGAGLVLIAPHDPLPLLAQLAERSNNGFAVEYLERGPEVWRLLLVRRSS